MHPQCVCVYRVKEVTSLNVREQATYLHLNPSLQIGCILRSVLLFSSSGCHVTLYLQLGYWVLYV